MAGQAGGVGAELFHTVPSVEEAGDGGEDAGAEDPDMKEAEVEVPFEQDPADGDHLEEGGKLAGEAGADGDFADDKAHEDGAHAEKEVPANNNAGEPEGNRAEIGRVVEIEQDDGGDEEEFIGGGVEDGAEFAALVVFAGDVAIHPIQDGGNGEGEHAGQAADFIAGADVVDDLNHEEGNEEDAKDGDFIGGGHRSFLLIAYVEG